MKSLALFGILLIGCSSESLPADNTYDTEDSLKDDGHCIRRGRTCRAGGTHCCTGYCADTGYGVALCHAPLTDGSACRSNLQCQSKNCSNDVCSPVCGAVGASCDSSSACCSGFCQLEQVYSPNWRTCQAPQPDGAYCQGDNECVSHSCVNYVCGGVTCKALGDSCKADSDCCSGSYCRTDTYAPPTCVALVQNGAFCSADSHCQSGHCQDYVCAP
jgi:hypothetical protein